MPPVLSTNIEQSSAQDIASPCQPANRFKVIVIAPTLERGILACGLTFLVAIPGQRHSQPNVLTEVRKHDDGFSSVRARSNNFDLSPVPKRACRRCAEFL